MTGTMASHGTTVRDIGDSRRLGDAVELFRDHALRGCRGTDTVRTESTLVLYEEGVPIAAGEVRWNRYGVVGLNRMALVDLARQPSAERALLDYAIARRPPWVPEPARTKLSIAA